MRVRAGVTRVEMRNFHLCQLEFRKCVGYNIVRGGSVDAVVLNPSSGGLVVDEKG